MSDEALKNLPPDEGTGDSLPAEGTGGTQQELPGTETDMDQAERSRLGRKFKKFEDDFGQVKQTISRLEQLLAAREEPARGAGYEPFQQPYSPPVQADGPPEYITTPQDLEKYNAWKQRKEYEQQQAYVGGYLRRIGTIGMAEQDKDMHSEIERELKTNVHKYLRHTGDPYRDADINYKIAKAEVLATKYAEVRSKPNVQGDRSTPPSGVTANAGRMAPPPPPKAEIDEYTRKAMEKLGISEDEDWVKKSLQRTK